MKCFLLAILLLPICSHASGTNELTMPLILGANDDKPLIRIFYDDAMRDSTNAAMAYVNLLAATYRKSVPDIMATQINDGRSFVHADDPEHVEIQSQWISALTLVEIRPISVGKDAIIIDVVTFGPSNSENGRHAQIAIALIDDKWVVSKMMNN